MTSGKATRTRSLVRGPSRHNQTKIRMKRETSRGRIYAGLGSAGDYGDGDNGNCGGGGGGEGEGVSAPRQCHYSSCCLQRLRSKWLDRMDSGCLTMTYGLSATHRRALNSEACKTVGTGKKHIVISGDTIRKQLEVYVGFTSIEAPLLTLASMSPLCSASDKG